MPVPTLITQLDTAAANNSPPGTESARGNIDDYLRAHASFIRQVFNGAQSGSYAWAGTAGGTANALTLTLTPAITAYSAGQRIVFKSGASANSGVTTAAVSGLTPLAVQVNGAACVGGEIAANSWYGVLVDASLTSCQLNKIGRATLVELGAAASGANNDISSIAGVRVGIGAGSVASNTVYGNGALVSNTTGLDIVAIGSSALTANTVGIRNTGVGKNALTANTSGGDNTAVGSGALTANTSGLNNTAVGSGALGSNIINGNSTAVGTGALGVSTGGGNTAIGYQAGSTVTTGLNDTLIGFNAAPSAIGVSNEITLGNSSIATLRCQVTSITALSDARDKKDIAPLAAGLDFVQRLKPVSYVWNMRDGGKVDIPDTGFIAQELKQVQVDTGIDIPGLVYEENPEKLEAAYGKLLPVMVKAIQELSDELTALRQQLNL